MTSRQHLLVTGAAGFIGSHLSERLLADGHHVTGIDVFDDFYAPRLKRRNVAGIVGHPDFRLLEIDIRDADAIDAALGDSRADAIIHLAARAGVRPSIDHPELYTSVNVSGTVSMLALARRRAITRFVFGSSSSVYGTRHAAPFREADPVDHPISPYAATKRAGELICDTYAHLYPLSIASLRFFTVFGPRQRPDLAIHKFARLMLDKTAVPVFGDGSMQRDFTYVEDILGGILASLRWTADNQGHEIFNLGASAPVTVIKMVETIGAALGVEPRIEWRELQPGDVRQTHADISKARQTLGYQPHTSFADGVDKFVQWLRQQQTT